MWREEQKKPIYSESMRNIPERYQPIETNKETDNFPLHKDNDKLSESTRRTDNLAESKEK